MCTGFAAIYQGQTVLCCMEWYADIFTGRKAGRLCGHSFMRYRRQLLAFVSINARSMGKQAPMGVPHEGLLPMAILSGQLSA